MTHMQFPFKPSDFWAEIQTPTQNHGVTPQQEDDWKHDAMHFISAVGQSINLTMTAQSTALEFFHRYYAERSMVTNDVFLMSLACLYLAGKVDSDAPKSSREIVRHGLRLISPSELESRRLWTTRGWVDAARQKVCAAERALLYQLGFRFADSPAYGVIATIVTNYPIKQFLDEYCPVSTPRRVQLQSLAVWYALTVRTAPLVLEYSQAAIAAGCVWLAMKSLALDTSTLRTAFYGRPWYVQYGLDSTDLERIVQYIAVEDEMETQRAQALLAHVQRHQGLVAGSSGGGGGSNGVRTASVVAAVPVPSPRVGDGDSMMKGDPLDPEMRRQLFEAGHTIDSPGAAGNCAGAAGGSGSGSGQDAAAAQKVQPPLPQPQLKASADPLQQIKQDEDKELEKVDSDLLKYIDDAL